AGGCAQPFSISRKGDSAGWDRKSLHFSPSSDFVELGLRTILAGDQYPLAIGGEQYTRYIGGSDRDGAYALSLRHVPKTDSRPLPVLHRSRPATIRAKSLNEGRKILEFPHRPHVPNLCGLVLAIFTGTSGAKQSAVGSDCQR